MSNNPNSATPQSGSTTGTTSGTSSSAITPGGGAGSIGGTGSAGTSFAGASSDSSRGTQQSGGYTSGFSGQQSGGSSSPPFSASQQPSRFSDQQSQSSFSLKERARDNKTGIAIGVAVGAIAATAIPFMLSKRRSRGQDYPGEAYVDSGSREAHVEDRGKSTTTTNKFRS